MQSPLLQIPLEFSALLTGFFFSLFALAVISYYTLDMKYRQWAFGHILFSTAFLWTSIFEGTPFFFGEFLTFLFRVFGCFTILVAFNFKLLKKIPTKSLHFSMLLISILIWIPIGLGFISPTAFAHIASTIMFLSFIIIALMLVKIRNKTLIDFGTLLAFLFWGTVSLPMILLPILPEVLIFGYLQFIGPTIVSFFMFVAFVRSTRLKLETQLQVSQLFRNLLAHDLRNYLNIISSSLELAEPKDEESAKYLTIARESIASASIFMTEIRDTLLDLSAATPQLIDIDLSELVGSVVDKVQSEHHITNEQIDFSGIPNPCIVTSSTLLRQVIWNLLDNSIRYSIGTPLIEISVIKNDSRTLVISDRAGGIPDDLREALLFQTNGRNKLGLGLTIVRDLLQICDVQIDIVDINDNDDLIGTSFHLKFND